MQVIERIDAMPEPAYIAIAGEYARRIRSGELPPGTQMPSYADIVEKHRVSNIVARKAIELLQSQGLVRSRPRRGIFVADRPNLVRVSPERQQLTPEAAFRDESDREVHVERDTEQIPATAELAEAFGLAIDESITHVVTRVAEGSRPVSISDTYQPIGFTGVSGATDLEEAIADRLPNPVHAAWLHTPPGSLVKTIRQRFLAADGTLIMLSDVSYPRDRYDTFLFRMKLQPLEEPGGEN
jgi:GntR family transcriptional regulator